MKLDILVKTPLEDTYFSVLLIKGEIFIAGGMGEVKVREDISGLCVSLYPRGLLARGVYQSRFRIGNRNYSGYFKEAMIQCLEFGTQKIIGRSIGKSSDGRLEAPEMTCKKIQTEFPSQP